MSITSRRSSRPGQDVQLPFALPVVQGKKMKKKCCKKYKKGKRCKRCPGR
jgi:hypothetical protein